MNTQNDGAKGVPMNAWRGIVSIAPDHEGTVLGSVRGAYVVCVALADDELTFRSRVTARLRELELQPSAFEEVERLVDRSGTMESRDDLALLAEPLSECSPVVFGTFHAFTSEK